MSPTLSKSIRWRPKEQSKHQKIDSAFRIIFSSRRANCTGGRFFYKVQHPASPNVIMVLHLKLQFLSGQAVAASARQVQNKSIQQQILARWICECRSIRIRPKIETFSEIV